MILRKRAIRRFGNPQIVARLMPEWSRYKHVIKFSIFMAALAFLIIAWANPQWGSKKEKVKRKSTDVIIALDISQSMWCQDISPNRMSRAQQFTRKLVQGLQGERIGLVIFAGNAFLQMPLTTDYGAADLMVISADPNMAQPQGTDIGEAITLAAESFDEKNKQHKALIIISDGENHDAEAEKKAKEAASNGMLIFTVGVGTPGGGRIPMIKGNQRVYKQDKSGQDVVTRLNESMLMEVAAAAGGNYYNINSGDRVIEAMRNRIDKLEKQEFEQRTFSEYESYFQYFLAVTIIFLMLEFYLSYRKSPWLRGKDIFRI